MTEECIDKSTVTLGLSDKVYPTLVIQHWLPDTHYPTLVYPTLVYLILVYPMLAYLNVSSI
jgi:hypothetical protein